MRFASASWMSAGASVLLACAKTPEARTPHEPPAQAEQFACVSVAAEQCFNATDDNCNGLVDEGCGLPSGAIQFAIGWDKPAADVDLIVQEPSGEVIEPGLEARSGLVKERDCPGRNQECQGVNLENVYLDASRDPTRGRYQVVVRLESLHGEEAPVTVQFSSRVGGRTSHRALRFAQATEQQTFQFDW